MISAARGTFVDPRPHWIWSALAWAVVPFAAVGGAIASALLVMFFAGLIFIVVSTVAKMIGSSQLAAAAVFICLIPMSWGGGIGAVAIGTRSVALRQRHLAAGLLASAIAVLGVIVLALVPFACLMALCIGAAIIGAACVPVFRLID